MRLFLAFITCQIALVLTSAFLTAKSKAILASYSSLFAKVPERKRDERSMKSTTTKKSYSTSKPRVMYKASPKPAVIAKSVVEIVSNLKDDESDVKELVKLDDEERLQKVIARAGIASRRKAEELIIAGRVTVNGKMVKEVGMKVDARTDLISVDGAKIQLPDAKKTFWVILHKPRNTLTTTSDEKERDTIMDLVPKAAELRLLPVGRLERDTTGVVILTNENGWIHPLTHPSYRILKKFQVIVEGIPNEETLDKIRSDFQLLDKTTMAGCEVKLMDSDKKQNLAALEIQFEDSQPWAIQKMLDFIGHPATQIKRTAFGPIELKSLKRGQWRELTTSEVQKLKEACTKAPEDQIVKKRVQTNKRIQRARAYAQGNLFYTRKPGSGYYLRTISRALPSKGEDGKTMVAKPAHLRTRRGSSSDSARTSTVATSETSPRSSPTPSTRRSDDNTKSWSSKRDSSSIKPPSTYSKSSTRVPLTTTDSSSRSAPRDRPSSSGPRSPRSSRPRSSRPSNRSSK